MPFTTNLSGTAQVDDSIIEELDVQFLVSAAEFGVMDQFVTFKKDIGAKSIGINKYGQLDLATTPLTEVDDVTSEAMSDEEILFTPQEYGKVVTTTNLANLQTGGKADLAAARLVGTNMGRTQNKLAILAAEASSVEYIVDGGLESALTSADVMTKTFLNYLYNRLSRNSVPMLADGMYAAIMHDDVIHDIRDSSGWVDVQKYANAESILRNEVGSYCGFRIVRDNLITITENGGNDGVDTYKTLGLGLNALGKATSQIPGGRLSGPFDKLGRFVNFGWYGVFKYGILDQDALVAGVTASSVGENASIA